VRGGYYYRGREGIQPTQTKGKIMGTHRTTYRSITSNRNWGIYSECDYMATHSPVGGWRFGKSPGEVWMLRVHKVPAEFSRPSARWLAEVVVPGERVHVLPGSVGATRDAAVLAAVKNTSEVYA
tara:strand:+ start:53 stop:424 length:372 start_codon:yes stop_codon:yes gene_type:complete